MIHIRQFLSSPIKILLSFCIIVVCTPSSLANEVDAAEGERVSTHVPSSAEDLARLEERVAAVVKQKMNATVCVQSGGGSGSGVIISEDGYVLTAGHVAVEPGRRVTFIFPDGKKVKGESLGINVGIDAGLMKITDKGKWPYAELGDMSAVKAGSWVVAMGHPGGFDKERSVVARLGRVYRVRSSVIQTDCTIIGGDSGGPLFDLGKGAALARVSPNSPASRAGLLGGDVVIELDRSPIGSFGDLAEVVGKLEPGDRVPVVVMRRGEEVALEIVIGKAGEP